MTRVELQLTLGETGRLSADVYLQLRRAILEGRLAEGATLPATRVLARRLAVSRNTILGAYERLVAEGFLVGRAGAGTAVAAGVGGLPRRTPSGANLRPRRFWRAVAAAPVTAPAPVPVPRFDFRLGAPDPRLFPWDAWRIMTAMPSTRPSRAAAVDSAAMARKAGHLRRRGAVSRSEQDRRHAESRRVDAEAERAEAEGRRTVAESQRVDAETLRRLAEEARAFSEKARASAEEARGAADEARRHLDTVRTLAEGIRRGAEARRESAEVLRRDSATRSEAMTRRTIREEMQVFSELERTKAEWPRGGGGAGPRSPAKKPTQTAMTHRVLRAGPRRKR